LLNIYGDKTVGVSTHRWWWVVLFSNGDSGSPLLEQIVTSMARRLMFNTGENVEKHCFEAENLLYQVVLLCSLYLL